MKFNSDCYNVGKVFEFFLRWPDPGPGKEQARIRIGSPKPRNNVIYWASGTLPVMRKIGWQTKHGKNGL